MKVKIFQVSLARDRKGLAFSDYRSVEQNGGVDRSTYDEVYSGSVNVADLEALYRLFNGLFNGDQRPFAHRMRSMSVSDLVEVVDPEGADVDPGLYFCDSIGFEKIY